MRQLRLRVLLLFLATIMPCAYAQKTANRSPLKPTAGLNGPPSAPGVRTVTLGNATVPLDGLWKFHIGDNMAWAQPDFDDSAWGTMDLTPPGTYNPIYGTSGYVPGWTDRGYKGYSGYAWYRLQVIIQNNQTALALKMPDSFDDAYQVYVDGQRIGEFGRFTAQGVTMYIAEPRAFPLPANLRSGPATVAIRMWMGAFTPLVDPDAGGLHGPPVLGHASAIAGLLHLDWDTIDRTFYSSFLESAILLLALLVAFSLFWLDRKEPAYLWLGLTCAVILASDVLYVLVFYTTRINGNLFFLLDDAALIPVDIGLWVVFWAYWFRLVPMVRLHRMVWGLVLLLGIGMAMLRAPLYGSVVPVHAIVWLSPLTLALKLLMGLLLIWVTVHGIRKNKTEGWLALPAVVLVALSLYPEELAVLHVPVTFFPFGVSISLGQMSTILSLLIITVLLLRRFLHGQREREQWKLEIEQARQLQQMLIPEAVPSIPGFRLESEYRPAHRVGGDFFQIIRHPTDGGLLIVLGDVTGHGLKAAMLVSLLVGAIREHVERDYEPLALLQSLNRRLLGRSHAQATCLALRLMPDGAVTLANAGHLPPYSNGRELPIEGAPPLGMMESSEFSVMQFQLQPGDLLTLLTDGVVEAQNLNKELFGFDRTSELMHQQKSAAEVAAAAQSFGQQDDITVLQVVRDGAVAMAQQVVGQEAIFS